MKTRILAILATLAVASSTFAAVEGSDNGSTYGGTWGNGSGANAAFSAWTINSGNGSGFAGTFIGDPATAGISGMSASSFGQFANPTNSGAFVTADRSFVGALSVGQTFSVDWGINFDSGSWDTGNGNKGFNLYSGGTGGTELLNVNNGANSDITLNGNSVGFGYGVNVMTWSFTLLDANTLQVQANDRDGTGTFSQNLAIAAAPDSIRLYATSLQAGDNAQPYYNNFTIVPEPSTMVMALMGAIGLVAARRRLQK